MAVTIDTLSGSVYASYSNVKDTFPQSVASTGAGADTVAVSGYDITGTGTAFTTDYQKGDYIWLIDNDEIRRIDNIVSDTKMTLEQSATTDASTTHKVVPRQGFKSVSFLIDSAGAANINGVSVPASASDSWTTHKKFIPVLIDSTVNANVVTVTAKPL